MTRGRHRWKFCQYPAPIGTKKFFLAGTRYSSVPKTFFWLVPGTKRYPISKISSVPGTQRYRPLEIFSVPDTQRYQISELYSLPGTQRYPTSQISSVPSGTDRLKFSRYPGFLNFDGYRSCRPLFTT